MKHDQRRSAVVWRFFRYVGVVGEGLIFWRLADLALWRVDDLFTVFAVVFGALAVGTLAVCVWADVQAVRNR